MLRLACPVVLAALLLAGCDDDPSSPSTVIGRSWQLTTIESAGAPPVAVPDPAQYTVRLEADHRLAVKSDCNSCGGTYALTGSTLELSGVACTRVFCGDGSLDARFSSALQGRKTVSISGSEMTIADAGLTLRFRQTD